MAALSLNRRQRKRAVHWFSQGKTTGQLGLLKAWWLNMATPLLTQRALMLAICLCHSAQLHGRPSQARRYRCEDAIVQSGLPVGVSDAIFDHYAVQVWPQAAAHPRRRKATKTPARFWALLATILYKKPNVFGAGKCLQYIQTNSPSSNLPTPNWRLQKHACTAISKPGSS